MGEGSLVRTAATTQGIIILAIIMILMLCSVLLKQYTNKSIMWVVHAAVRKASRFIGKVVRKREKQYQRDITIGKLNNKMRTVKVYKFMRELIIDLKLEYTGITPYELLGFIIVGSFILVIH